MSYIYSNDKNENVLVLLGRRLGHKPSFIVPVPPFEGTVIAVHVENVLLILRVITNVISQFLDVIYVVLDGGKISEATTNNMIPG